MTSIDNHLVSRHIYQLITVMLVTKRTNINFLHLAFNIQGWGFITNQAAFEAAAMAPQVACSILAILCTSWGRVAPRLFNLGGPTNPSLLGLDYASLKAHPYFALSLLVPSLFLKEQTNEWPTDALFARSTYIHT